jgi:hypothetical protein
MKYKLSTYIIHAKSTSRKLARVIERTQICVCVFHDILLYTAHAALVLITGTPGLAFA